ncbi:MAG: cytochrome c, partial [Candidatus Paceibacterota bacterium]
MTFSRQNAPRRTGRSIFSILFLFILSASQLTVYGQDAIDQAQWDAGKALFKSQCQSCHLPDKKMTGPALLDVRSRWIANGDYQGKSGEEWMYDWIRNNASVLATGHTYANAVYNEYDKSVMTLFPQLSNEDIDGILYYVQNYKAGAPVSAVAVPGAVEGEIQSTFPMKTFLWILVVGLGLIALVLWRVFAFLNKLSRQKEGLTVEEELPI